MLPVLTKKLLKVRTITVIKIIPTIQRTLITSRITITTLVTIRVNDNRLGRRTTLKITYTVSRSHEK